MSNERTSPTLYCQLPAIPGIPSGGTTMLKKFSHRPLAALAILAVLLPCLTRAQTPRPAAPPFNPASMQMQAPPPEGVAIRAGRMFDARTGKNLMNQVIVVKGDRIVDVGPAERVRMPQGARLLELSRATVLHALP